MKKLIKLMMMVLVSVLLFTTVQLHAATGVWHQDTTGWWFQYSQGGYPKNKWESIKGKWYHFDKNGYMDFNEWIDNMYYVGKDGAMVVNTIVPGGYVVGGNGKYQGQWKKDDHGWWFRRANRTYPKNQWELIGGKWYHFDEAGYMQHDQWIWDSWNFPVKRAYVGSDGAMIANRVVALPNDVSEFEFDIEFYLGPNGYAYTNKWRGDIYYNEWGERTYFKYSHDGYFLNQQGVYERNSYVNMTHPKFKSYDYYKEGEGGYQIYTIDNRVYAVTYLATIPVNSNFNMDESLSSFQRYFMSQSILEGFDYSITVNQFEDSNYLSINYFAYLKDPNICSLVNNSLIYGILNCNYVSFSEIQTILENEGFVMWLGS